MPIIDIKGMPGNISQKALEDLTDSIKRSIASIGVLGIPEDDVTIFYIVEWMQKGPGEKLIAEIKGLYKKPERTGAVLEQLRINVCDCLWDFAYNWLPQNIHREVMIGPMVEEKDCTYSSGKTSTACPHCRGRGGFGSDTPCDACEGSGRVVNLG